MEGGAAAGRSGLAPPAAGVWSCRPRIGPRRAPCMEPASPSACVLPPSLGLMNSRAPRAHPAPAAPGRAPLPQAKAAPPSPGAAGGPGERAQPRAPCGRASAWTSHCRSASRRRRPRSGPRSGGPRGRSRSPAPTGRLRRGAAGGSPGAPCWLRGPCRLPLLGGPRPPAASSSFPLRPRPQPRGAPLHPSWGPPTWPLSTPRNRRLSGSTGLNSPVTGGVGGGSRFHPGAPTRRAAPSGWAASAPPSLRAVAGRQQGARPPAHSGLSPLAPPLMHAGHRGGQGGAGTPAVLRASRFRTWLFSLLRLHSALGSGCPSGAAVAAAGGDSGEPGLPPAARRSP